MKRGDVFYVKPHSPIFIKECHNKYAICVSAGKHWYQIKFLSDVSLFPDRYAGMTSEQLEAIRILPASKLLKLVTRYEL